MRAAALLVAALVACAPAPPKTPPGLLQFAAHEAEMLVAKIEIDAEIRALETIQGVCPGLKGRNEMDSYLTVRLKALSKQRRLIDGGH